jgi:hypothetical protein
MNLLLAGALAFILRTVYVSFGQSLSNRKAFARHLVLISVTTMLIITIVKSSLALSLGLVGALSIVRFRTAIKEPEELAYLFLAIAVGLGLGADQRVITLVAFAVIVGIIWLTQVYNRSEANQYLYLTVSSHNPGKAELEDIIQVLRTHCAVVSLRRIDDTEELLEASFQATFDGVSQMEAARRDVQKLGAGVRITFLGSRGLGSY